MRILLTGVGGQVGTELAELLSPEHEVIGVNRQTLDLAQPETISSFIASVCPELIINAAAYTAVDRAETESSLAFAVNAEAPGQLAKSAQEVGAGLIHISTDYVFSGQSSQPYDETALTGPTGVYGQSKLLGEKAVLDHGHRTMVLRTAWVYGVFGQGNFVKTMLRLGAEREELRVVYDQIGTPTWARDIAHAVVALIPHLDASHQGIYHFTNSGVTSWYDFAVAIFEEAAHLGFPLTLERVIPIRTAEYPLPAQRPAYSVLACEKIKPLLPAIPPHWRVSLRKMMTDLYSKNH